MEFTTGRDGEVIGGVRDIEVFFTPAVGIPSGIPEEVPGRMLEEVRDGIAECLHSWDTGGGVICSAVEFPWDETLHIIQQHNRIESSRIYGWNLMMGEGWTNLCEKGFPGVIWLPLLVASRTHILQEGWCQLNSLPSSNGVPRYAGGAGWSKSLRSVPDASKQCFGRAPGLCAIPSSIQSNMPSSTKCYKLVSFSKRTWRERGSE